MVSKSGSAGGSLSFNSRPTTPSNEIGLYQHLVVRMIEKDAYDHNKHYARLFNRTPVKKG